MSLLLHNCMKLVGVCEKVATQEYIMLNSILYGKSLVSFKYSLHNNDHRILIMKTISILNI